MNNPAARYLMIVLPASLISVGAMLVAVTAWPALDCDHSDYRRDTFFGYCSNNKFSDYEFGAYYYGLEPEPLRYLKQADVLILGNSRTQFGLSQGMDDFFAGHGLHMYQLSFGHDQRSQFALSLIQRYGLKPKILIINADPYFGHELIGPAREIAENPHRMLFKYILKKAAIEVTDRLCSLAPVLCNRLHGAMYRSIYTGQWQIDHYPSSNIPLLASALPVDPKLIADSAKAGEEFLSAVAVNRDCVVLTGVPASGRNDAEMAAILSRRLKTRLLNVTVAPMASVDGNHMTVDTARRLDAKFAAGLPAALSRCPAMRNQN